MLGHFKLYYCLTIFKWRPTLQCLANQSTWDIYTMWEEYFFERISRSKIISCSFNPAEFATNYFFYQLTIINLSILSFPDNPLICDCELIWFPNLLKDLKDKDDEMAQKKRPMCTMLSEVKLLATLTVTNIN